MLFLIEDFLSTALFSFCCFVVASIFLLLCWAVIQAVWGVLDTAIKKERK